MTFIPRNDNSIHRRDLGLTEPWSPRQRAQNEALPPAMSLWERPVYQPPREYCARAGALDFKKVKSR